MADILCEGPVLSDSLFKPRPDFGTFLRSDATGNTSAMEQIEQQRRVRHLKFPALTGRHDYDSFTKDHSDPAFKIWHDDGDFHAPAPNRDYNNIIDPVSGFVSAGGEVDRMTNRSTLKSLVQLPTAPTAIAPHKQNSVRPQNPVAPTDIRRMTTLEPGQPSLWNSRQVSDIWIRSQLGGWTSKKDPRKNKVDLPNTACTSLDACDYKDNKEYRDKLALRFRFSSSTQSGYEDISWDEGLRPKKWSPLTTLEDKPDTVSFKPRLYADSKSDWQTANSWFDWYQVRKGYYDNRPVTFCSVPPRSQHIPGYSGCIGGRNLDDLDNMGEAFDPLTVKRVSLPRYVDTAHRPDIPRYEGCTLFRGKWAPMHTSSLPDTPKATTSSTFRRYPVYPVISDFTREAPLSKTVRTVKPGNPFTREHEHVAVEGPAKTL